MTGAAGQIGLVRFPTVQLANGKLHPVSLIAQVPGRHGDWLVCMVSSQLHQAVPDFDEVVVKDDHDFASTGLKVPSVIRLGRLAVVDAGLFEGVLGAISPERVRRVRERLCEWLGQLRR